MLIKSKEEMNGAARIILNNLDELFEAGLLGKGSSVSAQSVLESAEWVHVYNLAQRLLFINIHDPHFGVLGELEKEAKVQAVGNEFSLRYEITSNGIKFHYVDNLGNYMYTIEVWCLERAIQGLQLNMPSSESN